MLFIFFFFFFFNDTATTEIYTLSLHDALPIWRPTPRAVLLALRRQQLPDARLQHVHQPEPHGHGDVLQDGPRGRAETARSEEHTSELQSRLHLVCRLLLEKKKTHRLR